MSTALARQPATEKVSLSPRQLAFVKNYSSPKSHTFGNARQSAIAAGFSPSTSENIMRALSEKAKASIVALMDKHGLDDDSLMKRHAELLSDQQPQAAGMALSLAYRLKGHITPTQVTTIVQNVFVELGVRDKQEAAELIRVAQEAKEKPLEQILIEAAQLLAGHLRAYPDQAASWRNRIFGIEAEVVA